MYRIARDILLYRLRKLEMIGHLASVIAIMIVLHRPFDDVLIRSGFALFLIFLTYLNHDFCDVERDLASGTRADKTNYLAQHLDEAAYLQGIILFVLLLAAVLYNPWLVPLTILIAAVAWGYSALCKGIPVLDVAGMALWGTVIAFVAFFPGNGLGWILAGQLGLLTGASQTIQLLRDRNEDRSVSVKSTAVVLGPEWTLYLGRVLIGLAGVYGVIFLHRYLGTFMFAALCVPYDPESVGPYWIRVRILLGLAWFGILGWIFVYRSTPGLLKPLLI